MMNQEIKELMKNLDNSNINDNIDINEQNDDDVDEDEEEVEGKKPTEDEDLSETSEFSGGDDIDDDVILDDNISDVEEDDNATDADGDSVINIDKKKKGMSGGNTAIEESQIYKEYKLGDWLVVKKNDYYKKLTKQNNNDYIENNHPEILVLTNEELQNDCNKEHKTFEYLTKYEKTKVIGLRATQLSTGCPVFIDIPKGLEMNEIAIAELELEQRKIPFIIKRPFANGKYECWRVSDLKLL